MGFEKTLGAAKVIKDQIQYRSQSLLNLARGYFTFLYAKSSPKIFRILPPMKTKLDLVKVVKVSKSKNKYLEPKNVIKTIKERARA